MKVSVTGAVVIKTQAVNKIESLLAVKDLVNHLPAITGPEEDVQYIADMLNGSEAIISMYGDIQNTCRESILEQTKFMLNYLSYKFKVLTCTIVIDDGYDSQPISIANPVYLEENYSS